MRMDLKTESDPLQPTAVYSLSLESDVESEDKQNLPAPSTSDYKHSTHDKDDKKQMEAMYGLEAEQCCNSKCNSKIPKDIAEKYQTAFTELSKYDQDLVVLSHLEANKQDLRLSAVYKEHFMKRYGKRANTTKIRCDTKYVFRGLPICRKMYLFIHNIGQMRYENLSKHIDREGLTPRRHGLIGKKSTRKTTISEEAKERAITFIKNYAEANAIPQPLRKVKDFSVLKLPPTVTKSSVYNLYINSVDGEESIGNRSFRNLWRTHVPYITTMTTAGSLCGKCRPLCYLVE